MADEMEMSITTGNENLNSDSAHVNQMAKLENVEVSREQRRDESDIEGKLDPIDGRPANQAKPNDGKMLESKLAKAKVTDLNNGVGPELASANLKGITPKNSNTMEKLGDSVLDLKSIKNIKVKVQAMLGGISMTISELSSLKEGELVSLERNVGDEIEILANGQLIGHGEIVVIEGNQPKFGITITNIAGFGEIN